MSRFRLLFGISVFWLALSVVFDGVNSLVLPKRLLDLSGGTNSATQLGLLTLAGLGVGLLVQPLAGRWSDRVRARWGRRAAVASGTAICLVALLAFGLAGSVALLFPAYIALQAGAAVAQAGQQGFIPDLVPQSLRGRAAGFKGLMDVGGATLGFLLLGKLLAQGSLAPALAAIGAALLAALALTTILVREPKRREEEAQTVVGSPFRLDLTSHRRFVWAVAARFLFLLGTYAVGRFLLYYVADRLHLDPARATEQAGALLAGLTLMTALAAPPAGWAADRWGRGRLMIAGSILSALGTGGLILAADIYQIFLCGAAMALGSGAFAAANWALTTELAPPREAGRFMGLANIGTAGGAAAAGLFGPLVDWRNHMAPGTGFTWLFLAASLAFMASIAAAHAAAGRAPEASTVEAHAERTMS